MRKKKTTPQSTKRPYTHKRVRGIFPSSCAGISISSSVVVMQHLLFRVFIERVLAANAAVDKQSERSQCEEERHRILGDDTRKSNSIMEG